MRRRRSRVRADERGFSAIEAVVVTLVLGLAVASLFASIVRMTETTAFSQTRGAALDQIRLAADTFTKDARQGAAVASAGPSSFTFTTYIDATREQVTWQAVTSDGVDRFERVVDGAVTASYVLDLRTTSVFSYFGVSDPSLVTRVRLVLEAEPDARRDTAAIESEVDLRNVA